MASLALGTLGNVIVPGIGGFVGAALGAAIDTFLIGPALQGTQSITGPRLYDFNLQGASEGEDLAQCYGPLCKVGARIIWFHPLPGVAVEQDSGGKGSAPSTSSTTYEYFVDLALAWCGGPISRVLKIWADAQLIYDVDNPSAPSSFTVPEVSVTANTISTNSTDSSLNDSANGFADILEGHNITISGLTGVNGRYRVTQKISNGKLIVHVLIFNQIVGWGIPVTTAAAGPSVVVKQDSYQIPAEDARYEAMVHYLGTATQLPDAVIESVRGVGKVPAYRDTAYTRIKRFAVKDFGNRTPNFQALIEAQSEAPVASTLSLILTQHGLDSGDFDVSRVKSCLRGYVVSGPQDGLKVLEPLLAAYNILVQENAGQLVFFQRGEERVVNIDDGAPGARAAGDPPGNQPYLLEDTSGFDLPGVCVVNYVDPDNDFQTGSQLYQRVDRVVDAQLDINLPMVFSGAEAQQLARTSIWQTWAERQKVTMMLPPKYQTLLEGEIAKINHNGQTYSIRVDTLNKGVNYLVEVVGTLAEVETAQPSDVDDYTGIIVDGPNTGTGSNPDTGGSGPSPYAVPDIQLELMDIPALRESETMVPVLYWAMCAKDANLAWHGATGLASANDQDFVNVFSTFIEAKIGVCDTTLGVGPVGYWDRGNSLEVTMTNGNLSSVDEAAVLEGANWAVVGGELIAFQNAELIGAGRYRLSMLLRGLRGTEWAVNTHYPAERFVLVSALSTPAYEYGTGLIDTTRFFRGVAIGGSVTDAESVEQTLKGNTMRQFAPCNFAGVRNLSTRDFTLSWTRRSRSLMRLFSPNSGPLLADVEQYEIDFYQPGGELVYTTQVTGATSFTMTAADQVAAGLTNTSNVEVQIYQMGPIVGRGFGSKRIVV